MPGMTYLFQTPSEKVSVPPLISRAASRRFYFDVVNSAYGWRVQISQVTAHYRSIISFPINELIHFREKLNELMDELGIDRPSTLVNGEGKQSERTRNASVTQGTSPKRERGGANRRVSGNANRGGRRSFRRTRKERKSESERDRDCENSVEKEKERAKTVSKETENIEKETTEVNEKSDDQELAIVDDKPATDNENKKGDEAETEDKSTETETCKEVVESPETVIVE